MKVLRHLQPTLEKAFEYKGYRCVVLFQSMGFRTAYVALPKDSQFYGVDCDEIPVECHGGLTYADFDLYSQGDIKDVWWIGFDCWHYFDKRDIETYKKYYEETPYMNASLIELTDEGEVRTIDFCVKECANIVRQIINLESAKFEKFIENKNKIIDELEEDLRILEKFIEDYRVGIGTVSNMAEFGKFLSEAEKPLENIKHVDLH